MYYIINTLSNHEPYNAIICSFKLNDITMHNQLKLSILVTWCSIILHVYLYINNFIARHTYPLCTNLWHQTTKNRVPHARCNFSHKKQSYQNYEYVTYWTERRNGMQALMEGVAAVLICIKNMDAILWNYLCLRKS